jgi:hypothetical protein
MFGAMGRATGIESKKLATPDVRTRLFGRKRLGAEFFLDKFGVLSFVDFNHRVIAGGKPLFSSDGVDP